MKENIPGFTANTLLQSNDNSVYVSTRISEILQEEIIPASYCCNDAGECVMCTGGCSVSSRGKLSCTQVQ